MTIRLSLEKRVRKLITDSRGFSSVIGTVFMVLVVMFLSTSVFLWTLSQNTLYNQAVKEIRQTESDWSSEAIATSHANYTIPQTGTVEVGVTITNEGPVSAQIITAWVVWVAGGEKRYGFNDTLNINLNPGETLPVTIRVSIPDVSSTGTLNGWLATARGNLVPLQREEIVVTAQVALGIGSVMMDFDRFKYYIYHSTNKSLTPWDEGTPSFNITAKGKEIVFGVLLSNYDQYRRTITLDPHSLLWTYSAVPGLRATWQITNVASNGTIIETYTPISLAYGESKWLFFGPEKTSGTGAVAVNLILLGKMDDQDYGQNVPFVSIYVSG